MGGFVMSLYEKLLRDKANGNLYPFHEISVEDLQTLYWEETLTSNMIAKLFDVTKSQVDYQRYKFGITVRQGVVDKFLKMDSIEAQSFNEEAKNLLLQEENIGMLARAVAYFSLRNDLEDDTYSKLSNEDRKALDKLIVNRLAYVFGLIVKEDWFRLSFLVELNNLYDFEWYEPVQDDGGIEKLIRKTLGIS